MFGHCGLSRRAAALEQAEHAFNNPQGTVFRAAEQQRLNRHSMLFAILKAAAVCLRGGKSRSVAIMHLREACRKPLLSGGVLVIVAPKIADVALCDQLVQEVWTGSGALLVNSEFAVTPLTEASPDLQPFLQSLATVYAFQPVAVKGLLGNMEVMNMLSVCGSRWCGACLKMSTAWSITADSLRPVPVPAPVIDYCL
eukprot:scaffold28898_cov21-Tisochrysis_lutea.AAC.1